MNDFVNSEIDSLVMGSSPASLQISADRATGETSMTSLPTPRSQVASSSGDVVPASEFTAALAIEQHLKLNDAIASIDSQLNAQTFDRNTGQPTGFKVTDGRERELLQLQKQSYQNAIDYLGQRALEQLPKRAERLGAVDDSLVAAAQRERNIATLAESQGSDGRPLGRTAATKLIDEAAQRALADRLVRGT
jgi:hypothetical protein